MQRFNLEEKKWNIELLNLWYEIHLISEKMYVQKELEFQHWRHSSKKERKYAIQLWYVLLDKETLTESLLSKYDK